MLAGRKNPSQLTGYVLLNGKLLPSSVRRRLCGYVVQVKIECIEYYNKKCVSVVIFTNWTVCSISRNLLDFSV